MSKFIGYTIGLECFVGKRIVMLKVCFTRLEDGRVRLQAVSGRTLAEVGRPATISAEVFEDRPRDAYDTIPEALWALDVCGYTPAALA